MGRETGFRYGLLAVILLVGLNLRGSIAAVSPLLPDIRADLHMSSAAAGLLTSLPVLCFALGAPGAAWLGRRLGIYRALLLGCLVIALATVIRPYAGTWLLLGTTVLLGLAMTVGNVLMPVAIKRDFGSAAGRITGVSTASLSTGAALAAALTPALAVWLGWRHALAVWAVLGVVAAVALARPAAQGRRSLSGPTTPTAPRSRGTGTGLRTNPVAWAVTAFLGLQSVTYYAVTAWMPTLLRDTAGLSLADAGLAMSLFQVLGIPGTLLVPVLIHRGRDQRALGVTIGVAWLVMVLGLVVAPGLWPVWCVAGGIVQGMGISYAFTILVLRSADDHVAARLSAMMQLLGYIVGASGPFLVGLIQGATGSWTLAMIPVWLAAAGLVVSAMVAGRDRLVRV
ncbi:MAG: MFS transporter [Nocardioides sp.]|uniref:MFS transporter n=1 Tax=Nocardioides sp. TaxID=35761 RepID=UPI003D6A2566